LTRGRTTFAVGHLPGALPWATMTVEIEDGALRVEDNRPAARLRKAS
jgi:hypothetical protein